MEDQASNVLHLVLENKISDDRFLTFACAASGELDEALWKEALKMMRHRHVETRDSHRTDSIHHRQRKAVIKHIIRPRLGASEALDEACGERDCDSCSTGTELCCWQMRSPSTWSLPCEQLPLWARRSLVL